MESEAVQLPALPSSVTLQKFVADWTARTEDTL